MKEILSDVSDKPQADAQMLVKGAPLDQLSFVTDAEEIVALDAVAPQPDDEPEEIVINEVPAQSRRRSFSDKASAWLNNPRDVSWDEMDSK